MAIQHDTVLGLISVAQSALGFGSAGAPIAYLFLRKREGQNRRLAEHFAGEVKKLRDEATAMKKAIQDSIGHCEARIDTLTARLNESHEDNEKFRQEFKETKTTLEDVKTTMAGVESFFERAKEAAAHSNVAFKEEKKPK